jgi:hypothetical protein
LQEGALASALARKAIVSKDARQGRDDGPVVELRARAAPLITDGVAPAPPPDVELLHRKALVALEEALPPREHPRLVVPGLASSAIIATEARVFVFKTGVRAGLPFGARLKEFEYETVLRVELRPAGDVDVIVVHAPLKISNCSSYWADSRDDPWRARNAIPVTPGLRMAVRSVGELSGLVDAFKDRGDARRAEHARNAQPAVDPAPDVVGNITQLEQRGDRAEPSSVCEGCGSELGEQWQFCPTCGAPAKAKPRGGAGQRRRR